MQSNLRRIYYNKTTGAKIVEVGFSGYVTPTTVEQDILTYTALSERNADSFVILEIPYDRHIQDFTECNGYRVNPATKGLEFSYPDPNEPEAPIVYEKPLSEQMKELKAENLATMGALAEVYEIILGGM
ncbi:hypothetical protein L479_02343 [Exiguobacterium sp. S17]|nr:hypothetical protein L479_02343 [Exiguobacterium sp. S17]